MNVLRLASFSEDGIGGNPAGVCILNEFQSVSDMQACAKEVGFSETAFACPVGQKWRVRCFAKMRKSCKSLILLVPKAGPLTLLITINTTQINSFKYNSLS